MKELSNYYKFVDRWRVKGTVKEVAAIIFDGTTYIKWWPSVYREAFEVVPPDKYGVGRVVEFYEKSLLPFTIRWQAKIVAADLPYRIEIKPSGAFIGRGKWKLEQDGVYVNAVLDWRVFPQKRIVRWASKYLPILKPLFRLNHNWALRKGEESLRLELARRHARTPTELARIPPPPGPAMTSLLSLVLTIGIIFVGVILALVRLLSN